MSTLLLEGVSVSFPHAPYQCQVVFMRKVMEALQAGQCSLLESPTGTGKTLSLLCAVLAWQQSVNTGKTTYGPKLKIEYEGTTLAPPKASISTGPVFVIYASRTHAQLHQVVQELKKTSYNPKTVVLGSRDQLCINDRIRAKPLKGAMLDQACNTLCAQHQCHLRKNSDSKKKDTSMYPNIIDIEDAVAVGKNNSTCPYFNTRDGATSAELLLMPYNYLLDASIRASLKIEWHRAVVIFDEAHNLEDVAASAASFSFSSLDLAACTKELVQLSNILGRHAAPESSSEQVASMSVAFAAANSSAVPSLANIRFLSRLVEQLEGRIDAIPLEPIENSRGALSRDLEGAFLLDLFIAAEFSCEKAKEIVTELRKCADLLVDAHQSPDGRPSPQPKLLLLGRCVEQLFKTHSRKMQYRDLRRVCADYRLYVREERSSGLQYCKPKRVVNLWAFCGGIAMEELRDLGTKSIIMTSGTLAPLESFKEDMRIPFPISLENSHVIQDKQLWVGSVGFGINGKQLNSSYNSRDSDEYKDEVGKSVLAICRSMGEDARRVNGGRLVFFPSYTLMDSMLERWKETGIFENLRACCGAVVVEVRAAKSRSSASASSSSSNRQRTSAPAATSKAKSVATDEDGDSDDERATLENVVSEFDTALRRHSSCLLLAVCRGKVSEGIDFKDSRARVVIIIGIPFAPFKDPWVELKMKYLDQKAKATTELKQALHPPNPYTSSYSQPIAPTTVSIVAAAPPAKRLSGREWYSQSAVRAVNQAIGRIIRHKKDWGAVFLLDDRYLQDSNISLLSKWVRSRIVKYTAFPAALSASRSFMTTCLTDPDLQQQQSLNSRSLIDPSKAPREVPVEAQFRRNVVIKESNISDEGAVFVDPNLLLSQRPQPAPVKPIATNGTSTHASDFLPPPSISMIYSSKLKQNIIIKPADKLSARPHIPAPQPKKTIDAFFSTSQQRPKLTTDHPPPPPAIQRQQEPATIPPIKPLKDLSDVLKNVSQPVIKPAAVPAKEEEFLQDASQSTAASQSQQYRPSKRAKLMVSMSTETTPAPATTSTVTKNALLTSLISGGKGKSEPPSRAFKVVSSSGSVSVAGGPSGLAAASKLGCTVCGTGTTMKGAARCGHVCCLECWTKWLRTSKTCPTCRAPTSADDISKLTIHLHPR